MKDIQPTQLPSTVHQDLQLKYKQVLNHIADGLPRYKAWQKVHPTCTSDEAARASVRRLLSKPEAQQYLLDRRAERDLYIDENNRLSSDGVASEFKQVIEQCKAISKHQEIDNPMLAIQANNTRVKALTEYTKFMGIQSTAQLAHQGAGARLSSATNKHIDSTDNGGNSNSNGVKNSITGNQPTSYDFIKDITAQIVDE